MKNVNKLDYKDLVELYNSNEKSALYTVYHKLNEDSATDKNPLFGFFYKNFSKSNISVSEVNLFTREMMKLPENYFSLIVDYMDLFKTEAVQYTILNNLLYIYKNKVVKNIFEDIDNDEKSKAIKNTYSLLKALSVEDKDRIMMDIFENIKQDQFYSLSSVLLNKYILLNKLISLPSVMKTSERYDKVVNIFYPNKSR